MPLFTTETFFLCCTEVHLNQSSPTSEFPSYSENGNDTSLLVSPVLVAGVVIGLVLFLSCVTIIIGSLRKDGRLRHPHLRRDAVYGKIAGYSKIMQCDRQQKASGHYTRDKKK